MPAAPSTGGGGGTWNTASWWNSTATSDQAWATGYDAAFGGTAGGTVSLSGPISAADLIFNTAGYTIASNTLTLTSGSVTMNASSGTIGSTLAGSAGLTTAGNGLLVLTGANTYSGATTISNGTLQVPNAGQLGSTSGVSIGSAGTFTVTAAPTNGWSTTVTGSGVWNLNGPSNNGWTAVSANLSGFTGTLNIGANVGFYGTSATNYPGNGATINIASGGQLNVYQISSPTGTVYLNGGTGTSWGTDTPVSLRTVNAATVNYNIILNTSSLIGCHSGQGGATYAGTIAIGSNTLTVNVPTSLAINGSLSGSSTLTTALGSSSNYLTLSGSNSGFAGTFLPGAASPIVFASSNAGSPGAVAQVGVSGGSGYLEWGGSSGTVQLGALTDGGYTTGYLQNLNANSSAATFQIGGLNTNTTYSGTIQNAASAGTSTVAIIKVGSGKLTLSGGNTYSGGTTISAGTLALGNVAALGGSSAGTLSVNGGVLDLAGYSPTAASNLSLNLSGGSIVNSGATATLTATAYNVQNGSIAANLGGAASGLTKTTSGLVTLSGSNTYGGATAVSAGTLALGAAGSIASSPTISIGSGATFDVTAQAANYHLLGTQTLNGTGSFTVNGAMIANNGSTIQPGGAAGSSSGTLNVGALTLNAGSILNYDFGSGLNNLINVTSDGGVLNVIGGGINLYNAGGTSQFSTLGTYTLMDYAGSLTGSASNLSVSNPNPNDAYTFNAGSGTLTLTIASAGQIWSGSGGSLTWSNTANWNTSAAPVSGNPIIFAGSVGLSNTNNIAGLTVAGLSFNSTAGAFNLSGNSIQLSGPLTNSSTALQTIGLNIGLFGGNQTFNAAAGNIAVNGVISDGGSGLGISKSGTGALALTASNTYSGATILSAGTLQIGNNSALGAGTLTVNGGAITSTGTNGFSLANPLSLMGNATLGDPTNSGALTLSGSGAIGVSTVQLTVKSPVTISGALGGGANGLTMLGPSLLALSGSNTYTGLTTAGGGTLQLNTSGAAAIAGNLTVSGGTAQLLQSNQIVSSGSVSVSAGLLSIGANSNTVGGLQLTGGAITGTTGVLTSTTACNMQSGTLGATLGGSAGLNMTGPGLLALTNSNTFSGATTISGGTLSVGHYLALQNSTVTTSSNGGLSFVAGNTAPVFGGLAGNGNVALTTAASESVTLGVGGNNQSTNYSGNLSGSGGLTKQGAGTLTLAASQSYTGPTVISGGVLQLAGATLPTASLLYDLNASSTSDYTTNGSGNVTTWKDLSPSGTNSFTNASSTVTVVSGGTAFNNRNVLYFNATATATLAMGHSTSPQTVFIVEKVLGAPTSPCNMFGDTGVDEDIRVATATTIYNPANNGDFTYNTGGGGTMYMNGVLQGTLATCGSAQLLEAYAGNALGNPLPWASTSLSNNPYNRYFDGYMGEVVAYSTSLSTTQRQAVEAYLMDEWFGSSGVNILPAGTQLTIAASSTLDLGGGTQTVAWLRDSSPGLGGSVINSVTVATALLTFSPTSSSSTFSGQILSGGSNGAIGLAMNGNGTQVLAGSNTYSGGTTIAPVRWPWATSRPWAAVVPARSASTAACWTWPATAPPPPATFP